MYTDANGREFNAVDIADLDSLSRGMDEGFMKTRSEPPEDYLLDFDVIKMVRRIEDEIDYTNLREPLDVSSSILSH